MKIPKYLTVEVMQILDFSVYTLPNFPLSLDLELISIKFDLDEFNDNAFASIQRWRFSSSVFALTCRVFLQMFDSSKQVPSANSCTAERCILKCKSLIYLMRIREPKTELCGTPDLTKRIVELS